MKEFDYEIDRTVFLSKSNFSEYIEKCVIENKGMTYFDAIIKFSNESEKDPKELIEYMSDVLLAKVRRSAIESELIKSDTYSLDELL